MTHTVVACQPVPLPSFLFACTALSQTRAALLPARHRASDPQLPWPDALRWPALSLSLATLEGRPQDGSGFTTPPACASQHVGRCLLTAAPCAAPSQADTGGPSPGNLPAACGPSRILTSALLPDRRIPHGSSRPYESLGSHRRDDGNWLRSWDAVPSRPGFFPRAAAVGATSGCWQRVLESDRAPCRSRNVTLSEDLVRGKV